MGEKYKCEVYRKEGEETYCFPGLEKTFLRNGILNGTYRKGKYIASISIPKKRGNELESLLKENFSYENSKRILQIINESAEEM